MGWESFRSETKILIWPKEDQGCSAFLVVAINVFFLFLSLSLSRRRRRKILVTRPFSSLSFSRKNARASMLSNELVLRDSFNSIPWKNSTPSRGFFRGDSFCRGPKCPRTRKNISLQRATRSNFDAQPVKKSDQRFSSTLYTNGRASLMFSHRIIHLSLFLSHFDLPSVIRTATPDLRVRQKKKERESHSDSHEYVTSVCQPRYFPLFERREREKEKERGRGKFHRWMITKVLDIDVLKLVAMHLR